MLPLRLSRYHTMASAHMQISAHTRILFNFLLPILLLLRTVFFKLCMDEQLKKLVCKLNEIKYESLSTHTRGT